MKKWIVMMACSALGVSLNAQDPMGLEETPTYKRSLGVHAGATTGFGFSFRYVPDRFGIQITGIPIFNGNNDVYTSTALSFLYTIREHEKLDLFTYFGSHVEYQKYESWIDIWPEPSEPTVYRETSLHFGLGAGVNFHLWDIIDLSLQGGYGLFNVNLDNIRTGFTGEIGLYYRF